MPIKLLIVTSHFPYGSWNEAFLEPELHALASSFDEVHVLPLKGGPMNRSLPSRVVLWEPVREGTRWSHAVQLLHLSTWRFLADILDDCRRKVGHISYRHLVNSMAAALWRTRIARNRRLADFLNSEDTKIVYAYWGHMPALVIPLARAAGAKTCVRYHSVDLYLERSHNQGFIPCRDEIQEATDLNIFISDHGLRYFNAHAGLTALGDRAIHRLGSPDYGPPGVRTATGDLRLVMVSVSSIGGVKRVHLIARLAKELAKSRPVEWHHFGAGKCLELEHELANLDVKGLKVKLWGDTPRAVIQQFYRSHYVTFFVNLSEFEGVPVSIMEALNADIPVVACDVGGTSEIVHDGQSGMLIAPCECQASDALARKILAALQPNGALKRCAPRRVWQEEYNADTNAARLINQLQELAHK